MKRTMIVVLVAAVFAACLARDPAETSSDELAVGSVSGSGSDSGSGSADPCKITYDTKCKYQWDDDLGPICWQDPAVPRETIDDPDGHTKPNCGFTHNVQGCNFDADWSNGDACDLVGGYTTKCQ